MINIFKFGGASVRDTSAIANMAHIISKHGGGQLVVVISAMGTTTRKLESIARDILQGNDSEEALKEIIGFHDDISKELNGQGEHRYHMFRDQFMKELDVTEKTAAGFIDKIIAFGELFSTSIIENFLQKQFETHWVDARDFIKTSNDFGEARIDWSMTENAVSNIFSSWEKSIYVTQGFIGSYLNYKTTTLGKEGSDYTATILAACLKADAVTVWKDVPGILNADPKLMDKTTLFPSLSYQELTEMTYYGAKVIHPKTMLPLTRHRIPLYVRSFVQPDENGTTIEDLSHRVNVLPTFIFKFDQMVVTLRVLDDSFMNELKMMRIFKVLDELNIKLNMMQNSALTFTICVHESEKKLSVMRDKLPDFQITYNEGLHLATIMNHTESAIGQLPEMKEIILEQKSRSVYQVLYQPV